MKALLMAGVAALALLAGCGVDKDGTGDNLVKEVEKVYPDLTNEQKSCLKDVVNNYSDEELKELSKTSASPELVTDFQGKIGACIAGE